ncbi:MAG: lectin-like protein, partial [Ilumatobacteraceae bacterium]
VPSYNITWTNALNLADDRTVSGDTGYLVTITNADENNFIKTYINAQKIWIAAADDQVEGDWRWRAGPESGQTFWKAGCDSSTNYCTGLYTDSTPLVNTYSSWASGEPNNWDGNEGYAVTNWNAAGDGLWNDLVYNSSGGVKAISPNTTAPTPALRPLRPPRSSNIRHATSPHRWGTNRSRSRGTRLKS